jgi:hypothetical protein
LPLLALSPILLLARGVIAALGAFVGYRVALANQKPPPAAGPWERVAHYVPPGTSGAPHLPSPADFAALAGAGGPAPAPSAVPAGWGWAKLHQRGMPPCLGYYYRDKMAGYSLHKLAELRPDVADVVRATAARGYRGDTTIRIGAHETLGMSSSFPPDLVASQQAKFDACDSPSGAVVLMLSDAERASFGLPSAPPWISAYL